MSQSATLSQAGRQDNEPPEPLENGTHLSAAEFLRRYEGMPEVRKAELVNGIVYMASPVRHDRHGKPDSLIQTWSGPVGHIATGPASPEHARFQDEALAHRKGTD